MSRDMILRDEKFVHRYSYDNLCTQNWLDGQAQGVQVTASYLDAKAVDLFRQGKHEEAIALQSLGKEILKVLVPKLEKLAEDHKTAYPAILAPEEEESPSPASTRKPPT